jgi:MFS family permease
MTPLAIIFLGAVLGISRRHSGEWADLKARIQRVQLMSVDKRNSPRPPATNDLTRLCGMIACLSGAGAVGGETTAMDPRDSIWYFPGDPPVFEMLAMLSLLVLGGLAVVGGAVLLMTFPRRMRRLRRKLLILVSALMTPFAVLFLGTALGICSRNFGEWADLKALIRQYSDLVAAEIEKGEDPRQMAFLELKLLSPTPAFKFRSLKEPVRLKIMQTHPPYVGVDFGNGANAVFDPQTMICSYSD